MNVVITGSTQGIGLALVAEFLRYGDRLVVSSRSQERVEAAVAKLKDEFPEEHVAGLAADVSVSDDVEALADFALDQLGSLDIWINNAGTTGFENKALAESDPDTLEAVVRTNLLGTLLGCRAALRVMLPQGRGHIFNMDGRGADGTATPEMAAYGATKRAIPQLTNSLAKETEGTGVGVHTLSPGMVLTDLLLHDATPEAKRIYNILAERPETVARWLVERARKVEGSGQYIRFLTNPKAAWRFATAWRRKNRFFDEEGEAVEVGGTRDKE
jgi:chlorophyll(ide) b reductase